MGARALLDIKLIWFVYIARRSQREEGGYLLVQMIFFLSSRRLEEGGCQHPMRSFYGRYPKENDLGGI
jgi:hypothetical protein